MVSRYDYMKSSEVCDKEDGLPYPDVLTTNYSDILLKEIPTKKRVSAGDIAKFWMFMYREYGYPYYDDLLLNINGIGYVGELQPGSEIYKLGLNDIINFDTNKRKEVE